MAHPNEDMIRTGFAALGHGYADAPAPQRLSPGRLVVLGEPGAGKTVLTIELQVRLLEQRNQDRKAPGSGAGQRRGV